MDVRLQRRMRWHRIAGRISVEPARDGTYCWRGRGPLLFASKRGWFAHLTPDGSVALLGNTGSMATLAGHDVLRRPDVSDEAARVVVRRHHEALRLSRAEVDNLIWLDHRRMADELIRRDARP